MVADARDKGQSLCVVEEAIEALLCQVDEQIQFRALDQLIQPTTVAKIIQLGAMAVDLRGTR